MGNKIYGMKDELLELLNDLEHYMANRADVVDGNSGPPQANIEMLFYDRIIDVIPKIEQL